MYLIGVIYLSDLVFFQLQGQHSRGTLGYQSESDRTFDCPFVLVGGFQVLFVYVL